MNTKFKTERVDAKDGPLPFSQLANGDWYESASRFGLCMKLSCATFWSFKSQSVVSVQEYDWACQVVNVSVRYRPA